MRAADRKILCRAVFASELVLLAAAYSLSGLLPEFFGGRPLVLIALGLSISASEDVVPATVFGAACGALTDLITAGSVGLYSFTLTLGCFLISHLLHSRLRPNFPSAATLALLSIVSIVFARYLSLAMTAGILGAAELFVRRGISKILLTFAAFLLLYPLNRLIRGGEK